MYNLSASEAWIKIVNSSKYFQQYGNIYILYPRPSHVSDPSIE